MQNNQTAKIEFNSDEIEHLMKVLNDHISYIKPYTDFSTHSCILVGRLRHHFLSLQPGGVGRSPVQPSGAVDQVTTYPFVVGE